MKKKNNLLFIIVICLLSVSSIKAQDTYGKVAISEVYFDTYMVEKQGYANHHAGEFIELYNSSNEDINISGWKIEDNVTSFTIPNNTIIRSGRFKVITFTATKSLFIQLFPEAAGHESDIILQNTFLLNNNIEKIHLLDTDNNLISDASYYPIGWEQEQGSFLADDLEDLLDLYNFTPIYGYEFLDNGENVSHSGAIPPNKKIGIRLATPQGHYQYGDNSNFENAEVRPFSFHFPMMQLLRLDNGFRTFTPYTENTSDSNLNWVNSNSYNIKGELLSSGISYFDELGKLLQSHTIDLKTGKIWVNETRYDASGRAAFNTLSAPIGNFWGYKTDFIKKTNGATFSDTDLLNIVDDNAPSMIGNQQNTLGKYYSNSNSDDYQDITDHPYSRNIYSTLNPGSVLKTLGGSKIDGKWKQGYSFSMPAAQEMYYVFGYDFYNRLPSIAETYDNISSSILNDSNKVINWSKVNKSIVQDLEGNESVVFTDVDGKTLASARSGGVKKYNVVSLIGEQKYIDIHLPKGCDGTLSFYGSSTNYKVFDLKTDRIITNVSNLPAGFYRIEYIGNTILNKASNLTYIQKSNKNIYPVSSSYAGVRYKVNYYEYSLNYYDKVGQLKSTLQPLGFNDSCLNSLSATVNHDYTLVSSFEQNSLGQLLNTSSPDEGDAKFKYRKDGQIRFSQNSKQSGVNTIIESNFEFDYGGWLRNGSVSYSLEENRLKVNVNGSWEGVRQELTNLETSPGEKFKIKLKFDKGNTQSNIRLYFQEKDSNGNHLRYRVLNENLGTGEYSYDYTVTNGTKLFLRIDKDNNNTNFDTYFYIDYISLKKESDVSEEFSYTNYDNLGRPIESGVAKGVFEDLIPDNLSFSSSSKSEQHFTQYDYLSDTTELSTIGAPVEYRNPSFLSGNVAKTSNTDANGVTISSTYYSYDIYGRVKWLVQDITGLGIKTIDYVYDPVTSEVLEVVYQKNMPSEKFIHKYKYNPVGQLVKVTTSTDGVNYTTHAEYKYKETGEVKRVELANNLQGIDYVYNLAGQLKAINHPSLSANLDPGGDSNDLFGMTIDYYNGDYKRKTDFSLITTGTNQYNGNIKGISSKTSNLGGNNNLAQYVYDYNDKNWLKSATFSGGNANASTDYKVDNITYDANGNIKTLSRNKNTVNGASNAMDQFTYIYKNGVSNKLDHVNDAITTNGDDGDLKNQNPNNYIYNQIGQLIENKEEDIKYEYNASGLVTKVLHNNELKVEFKYDDKGFRVCKINYASSFLTERTFYVRDASGSVLAIYRADIDHSGQPGSGFGNTSILKELPIYGASRLGVYNKPSGTSVYQLTDHLGNVRAVLAKDQTGNALAVTSATDYYPFGMPMPNRQIVNGEPYRYAFQGQEKDPETGKEAFQLRLWDARIGRWLTTDPKGEFHSPYLGMGNNPMRLIDPDGGSTECPDCSWFQNLWNSIFGSAQDGITNGTGQTNYSKEDLKDREFERSLATIESFNEIIPDAGEFNVQVTVPLSAPGTFVPFQNFTFGGSIYIDSYGNIAGNGNYGIEFNPVPSFDIGFDVSAIYAVQPHTKLHYTSFSGLENNYDLSLPTPYIFDANFGYFEAPNIYSGVSIGASVGTTRYSRMLPNGFISYSKTTGSRPIKF